jgi:tight adherence protein B
MINLPLIAAAALVGIAVGLFAWGCQSWAHSRIEHDAVWAGQRAEELGGNVRYIQRLMLAWYAVLGLLLPVAVLLPNPLVGLGLWLVLSMAPRLVAQWARERRLRRVEEQLPAVIEMLASSVDAGMTLPQAVESAAVRAPQPVRREFVIMTNEYRLGLDLPTVLRNANDRIRTRNFALFATALLTNREFGGSISDTLGRIARAIESLQQMQKRVRAMTAPGRTSIKVMGLAPVAMLGLISIMDARGVALVFTSGTGQIILAVAAVLTAVSLGWAWAIVNADL